MDPFENCHWEIPQDQCTLATCCLAQGSFTYRPSYGGNLALAIFFGVFMIPQLGLGLRYRTWGFMVGMLIGLGMEVGGYAARIVLHNNPFSNNAFLVYLILLTIAPVFMSAAIYLTLTRVVLLYGQHLLPIPARAIAAAFMTSDLLSLVLQATGGGLAEVATENKTSATAGQDIMIAGLFLQAVSLAVFAALWGGFMLRVRRGEPDASAEKVAVRTSAYFRASQAGVIVATLAILARSVFRVVELWGGFAGAVWNDETDFMVLDGAMIALAALLLTLLHPGPAFGAQWHVETFSLRVFSVKREGQLEVESSSANSEAKITYSEPPRFSASAAAGGR